MASVDYANARTVYQDLIGLGLSPGAATGVVGNLVAESTTNGIAVNPRAVQPGGPGRGIAQWSVGARWDQLLAWARGRNADPYALATQEAFMVKEMKTSGVWDQLLKTTDPLTSATLVMKRFEMPADQSNDAAARRAAAGVQALKGAGTTSSSSSSSSSGPSWKDWVTNPLGTATGQVANDAVSKAKPLVLESLFIFAALGLFALGAYKAFDVRGRTQRAAQTVAPLALAAA